MFALLALVPFALAACGDDDDDEAATEATTTEETDTGGDAGGAGSTVSFTADPNGDLAYEEDSATATAGAVTVELTNESEVPHDVQIEGPDGNIGGTDETTGGSVHRRGRARIGRVHLLLLRPRPPRGRHGGPADGRVTARDGTGRRARLVPQRTRRTSRAGGAISPTPPSNPRILVT